MRIITVANQKGGNGKTTTALALAQAARHKGKKVLCIDLDGQKNLTMAMRGNPQFPTAFELLTGAAAAESCIQHTAQGVDLIAGSYDLATLKTEAGSARRLERALKGLKGYSLIVIDTPPNVGEAQYNALQVSTDLIITVNASLFDLQGLFTMADTAQGFAASNPALSITGYILTNHNGRSKLAKALEESIRKEAAANGVQYLGTVRQGIAIREAQALGVSLFDYAPDSNPAKDYMSIFEKIV